ncbi:MAG: hypothetical protein JSR44_10915 [Spirochaetes bacterium]|nr:hypothetical protein [Spirochaetota bacterium]
MQHPSKIIKELGIAPLKKLGQNFQIDTHAVANAADNIPRGAKILEIGPGLGAWTEIFLARGHAMVLCEKDRTLAARLTDLYRDDNRVTVVGGDFLEHDVSQPPLSECSAAIGNLPFYVTSELLLRVVVDAKQIKNALFGIQREVAERIASGRGSSLAIALAAHGRITPVGKISRSSFYPIPNVDAAMIAFERREATERPHLRLLLKAAFWGKRKTLAVALKKNPFWPTSHLGDEWLKRIAAAPATVSALLTLRADQIGVEDFCALYDYLNT